MRKKRGCFLLIELMIAITLLGIFGLHFMKPSYEIFIAKRKELEFIQLGRLSKEQLLHVKMELLAKRITLPSEGKSLKGELPPVSCTLAPHKNTLYGCRYHLSCTKKSKKLSKKKGHIYTLLLTFTRNDKSQQEFSYPIYIEEVSA